MKAFLGRRRRRRSEAGGPPGWSRGFQTVAWGVNRHSGGQMNMRCVADGDRRHSGSVSQTSWDNIDRQGRLDPADPGGDRGSEEPQVERAVAAYEERLHAVRSGLAAVSAAAHVLSTTSPITGPTMRSQLGAVLIEEVERLQRLVSTEDAIATDLHEALDLDEILD